MNDELDQRLRAAIQHDRQAVPEVVRLRLEETLASLPERRTARLWSRSLKYAALCALMVVIVSTAVGFVSPAMAQMLSRIPLVGSVFQLAGDAGLQQSSEQGLATIVNETASDQGIDLTLHEVIYDGIRLSVGFVYDTSLDLRLVPGLDSLKINGETVHYSAGGVTKSIPKDKEAAVFRFTPAEPLPDQFVMTLTFNEVELTRAHERTTVQGEWKFETMVERLREGIYTRMFETPLVKKDDPITIELKEVVMTPITTKVVFDWIEPLPEHPQLSNMPKPNLEKGALTPPPPDEDEHVTEAEEITDERISYELVDANGIQLEPLSFGASGKMDGEQMIRRYEATFAPTDRNAEYLLFRPVKEVVRLQRIGPGAYTNAEQPQQHAAPIPAQYPLQLSQGEAGTLTIYGIEFTSEKTTVHYEVVGHHPYVQDGAFWLEDGNGSEYRFDRYDQERLSDTAYEYRVELPPIEAREDLVVKTVELNAPERLTQLEFRIPLQP